jgi:peptidoglycan/LPS O-acetylase OafA/YrhL
MPFFTAALPDQPKTLIRRVLSSSPMVLIGRLSYSIYLFHLLARTPGEVYFGTAYCTGSVVSGLLLTGAISYILFVFVERPIATLRRRLRVSTNASGVSRSVGALTAAPIIALSSTAGDRHVNPQT